jgi:excinuclease ABC subunit C
VLPKGDAITLHNDYEYPIKMTNDFDLILLPRTSNTVKLLQRIRDESHRFAVSYHSTLKRKRQASNLEEIPGIGPVTRKKLLRQFGSFRALSEAGEQDIAQVIGSAKAKIVYKYIKP